MSPLGVRPPRSTALYLVDLYSGVSPYCVRQSTGIHPRSHQISHQKGTKHTHGETDETLHRAWRSESGSSRMRAMFFDHKLYLFWINSRCEILSQLQYALEKTGHRRGCQAIHHSAPWFQGGLERTGPVRFGIHGELRGRSRQTGRGRCPEDFIAGVMRITAVFVLGCFVGAIMN